MKSYSSITGKYLKKQKKRSILNIIGIILSVALICSIGTMAYSMKEMEIKEAKESRGDYYFSYTGADNKLINIIKSNVKVENISIIQKSEKPINISDDLLLTLDKYDINALKSMPVNLKKGRLPEKSGEIIVEDWIMPSIKENLKLNDKIRLSIGESAIEYKIVGIMENDLITQYINTGTAIALLDEIPPNKEVDVFFKLKDGVSIKNNIEEFKKLSPKGFSFNELLLMYMGQNPYSKGDFTYTILAGILILLVIASTTAVIYNSFHISVLERIKQFGILRSIGATSTQIKKIVLKEATILSIIAIPIGILLGTAGLKGLFLLVASIMTINMEIIISPLVIFISVLLGILSVCFSAYVPARLGSKASPLDAIYNRGSIIKEKIRNKKGFIDKHFNIEATMANKNIRRNRKRFRITTFSIAISIILYIGFSSTINMIYSIHDKGNEELGIDYKIVKSYYNDNSRKVDMNKEYEKIKKIEGVDKVYKSYSSFKYPLFIPSEKMNKNYSKLFNEQKINNGIKNYNKMLSNIEIYDQEKLQASKKYVINGSADENKMNRENGVIIVLKTNKYSEAKKKNYKMDIADIKIGDTILLGMRSDFESNDFPQKTFSMKVVGILERAPFGDEYSYEEMRVITSKTVMDRIINKEGNNHMQASELMYFDVKLKPNANRTNISKTIKNIYDKAFGIDVVDIEDRVNRIKEEKLKISIFFYGFIGVIALIGSLNIVNTISANLILRKKEFATLKAIGMGMNQINKMVVLEGVLYGVVGASYGLLISLPISYAVLRLLNRLEGFEWRIPWVSILISLAAAVLIGLISVILPLKRIKEGNVTDDIRMEE